MRFFPRAAHLFRGALSRQVMNKQTITTSANAGAALTTLKSRQT